MVHRVPQAGVNADWPSSVYFTFQLYRFPPVTTQRLQLLEPEHKLRPDYPCVLSLINKDGTLSSGKISVHAPLLGEPHFFNTTVCVALLQRSCHELSHRVFDRWDWTCYILIASGTGKYLASFTSE